MLNSNIAAKLGRYELGDMSMIAAPSDSPTNQAPPFAALGVQTGNSSARVSLGFLMTVVLVLLGLYYWTRSIQA